MSIVVSLQFKVVLISNSGASIRKIYLARRPMVKQWEPVRSWRGDILVLLHRKMLLLGKENRRK